MSGSRAPSRGSRALWRGVRALWLARRVSIALPLVLCPGARSSFARVRARITRDPAGRLRRARWSREAKDLLNSRVNVPLSMLLHA